MDENYDNVIDIIRKAALPVALKYGDVPELAPLIRAIPYAGQVIDGYLNALAARYTKKNMESLILLLSYLQEEIEEVGLEKIDRDFFGSEEFHDIFFLVNSKVQRTVRQYKLRYLARLLKSVSLKDGTLEVDRAEEFIEIVDSLSRDEMYILFLIQEFFEDKSWDYIFGDETIYSFLTDDTSRFTGLATRYDSHNILVYLTRLRRFGFVLELTGQFRSATDPNTSLFNATGYLKEFLTYIHRLEFEDISD